MPLAVTILLVLFDLLLTGFLATKALEEADKETRLGLWVMAGILFVNSGFALTYYALSLS